MKVADYFWENPNLLRYLKEIPAGDYLFRQAEPATTMYIVVRGVVELWAETTPTPSLVSVVEAGQFLGEKAILSESPYPRAFSAKAKTRVLVFELGLSEVDKLKATVPELMTDLLKQMFLVAAQRLDRANTLFTVLRSTNNVERVMRLFLYFASHNGLTAPHGTEVFLQKSTINFYVDLPFPKIDVIVSELVGAGLVQNDGGENYTIPHLRKFELAIPMMVERLTRAEFEELEVLS